MTLPVFHVASLTGVAAGSAVELDGDEGHHAVVVRRLRAGESLVLSDGRGCRAVAEVSALHRRSLTAVVASVGDAPEPSPTVTVVQALPKGERGELAVEMLTEVGVARIVPWAASRSVAVWRGERADRSVARWRSTAREAAKQSRRAWFPEVDPLATTSDVAALVARADVAVVLHEEAVEPLAAVTPPGSGELLVVVGPEGGLTQEEVATFVEAGARAVRLGPEVLRTSTAGLAAVSALLARTPRWR